MSGLMVLMYLISFFVAIREPLPCASNMRVINPWIYTPHFDSIL